MTTAQKNKQSLFVAAPAKALSRCLGSWGSGVEVPLFHCGLGEGRNGEQGTAGTGFLGEHGVSGQGPRNLGEARLGQTEGPRSGQGRPRWAKMGQENGGSC
jgi:hypothetical protein